jgi:arylsulfatase A-like enzyme
MLGRLPKIVLSLVLILLVILLLWNRNARGSPNILLVTIDTLRADHLGCYGYSRATSPNLDALAAAGVLFENAFCVLPSTVPSHGSIFFGTWPRIHGSTSNSTKITNKSLPYLPDILHQAGYRTGAVLSAQHLGKALEEFPGFETFEYPPRIRSAKRTLRIALGWLLANRENKFFLWIHLWDPHSPYRLHPRLMSRINPEFRNDFEKAYEFLPDGFYSEHGLRGMIDLYDNEIVFVDRHLGKFFARLREHFLLDNTLTIIASDHGETLDELVTTDQYAFDHSEFLVEPQIRVPLIMIPPNHSQPGRRVSAVTSLVDLFPTILEAARVPVPPGTQGGSLQPYLSTQEDALPPRLVFLQRRSFVNPPRPFLASDQFGVRDAEFKLLYEASSGRSFLYRAGDDTHDVGADLGDVVQRLRDRLKRWLSATEDALPADAEPVSDEQMEKLKSLGYVH